MIHRSGNPFMHKTEHLSAAFGSITPRYPMIVSVRGGRLSKCLDLSVPFGTLVQNPLVDLILESEPVTTRRDIF
jgi:hypothetical protein